MPHYIEATKYLKTAFHEDLSEVLFMKIWGAIECKFADDTAWIMMWLWDNSFHPLIIVELWLYCLITVKNICTDAQGTLNS